MPGAASDSLALVVLIGLLVLIVGAGAIMATMRGSTPTDDASSTTSEHPADAELPDDAPLAAVVVNPSKFPDDGAQVRKDVVAACRRHGWREPLWLETTAESPGAEQAKDAVSQGASLVMACGGDGTVRQVAEVLEGTDIPLGLLPAGTGNLLARNIGMDVVDMNSAIEVALTGMDLKMDVGHISFDDKPPSVFLVMAGMGFDADVMRSAPEDLKAKVGPLAYAVTGLRHLNGKRTRVDLQVDGTPRGRRRIRAFIVGNCGKLVGNLVLMPDAEIDDGLLDAVSVAPNGIVGWSNVVVSVVTRDRRGHRTFERFRGRRIVMTAVEPLPAEIDGDPVGDALKFESWVDPQSLTVKVEGSHPADRHPVATALSALSLPGARAGAGQHRATAGSEGSVPPPQRPA